MTHSKQGTNTNYTVKMGRSNNYHLIKCCVRSMWNSQGRLLNCMTVHKFLFEGSQSQVAEDFPGLGLPFFISINHEEYKWFELKMQ